MHDCLRWSINVKNMLRHGTTRPKVKQNEKAIVSNRTLLLVTVRKVLESLLNTIVLSIGYGTL